MKDNVHEIVVISGKKGAGKTTLTAAFAGLSKNLLLADCDVDTPGLHCVLDSSVVQKEEFNCDCKALINQEQCFRCGGCLAYCRFDAVKQVFGREAEDLLRTVKPVSCKDCVVCTRSCRGKANDFVEAMKNAGCVIEEFAFVIDPVLCEGCGVCVDKCPAHAIDFTGASAGEWYVSKTLFGPLVHACLNQDSENPGALVNKVRETAAKIAVEQGRDLILADGPSGWDDSVIASVSGASLALIVAEPTVSGARDMKSVLELTRRSNVPAAVCVNKWDMNSVIADKIKIAALEQGAGFAGCVRRDDPEEFGRVLRSLDSEQEATLLAQDIKGVWESVLALCENAQRKDNADEYKKEYGGGCEP